MAIPKKRGLLDTPKIVKFGMDPPWACWLLFRKNQGPYEDHLVAIKGHILTISRERELWDTPRIVKFGMEHPLAH